MDDRKLRELRGFVKELQSQANLHLLDALQGIEEEDCFRVVTALLEVTDSLPKDPLFNLIGNPQERFGLFY